MTKKHSGAGRLGPRALKMKWEQFIRPAVFEIVCEATGRRFIGSSATPNLRKAAYFYQLRNIQQFDFSNIFFGCLEAEADVAEHGIDSFYFEIVKSMPLANRESLSAAAATYRSRFSPEQLYNRRSSALCQEMSVFARIDPAMAELEVVRCAARSALERALAEYKEFKHNRPAREAAVNSARNSDSRRAGLALLRAEGRTHRLECERARLAHSAARDRALALQAELIQRHGRQSAD